ncbi:MAG: DUF5522 domain-containing protein [Phycisphaerales bacterium]|nr:DUF5522 domain-containing protein [Phycisphaerales bacterium]
MKKNLWDDDEKLNDSTGSSFSTSNDKLIVFTKEFLLERGYCCGNGCKNCPYDYKNVPEPRKSKLLANRGG